MSSSESETGVGVLAFGGRLFTGEDVLRRVGLTGDTVAGDALAVDLVDRFDGEGGGVGISSMESSDSPSARTFGRTLFVSETLGIILPERVLLGVSTTVAGGDLGRPKLSSSSLSGDTSLGRRVRAGDGVGSVTCERRSFPA